MDVTPYRIAVADAELEELRRRLRTTRWPEPAPVEGWQQGAPLQQVMDLCRYWADGYDWRARETRMNEFAQFTTEIDGVEVHFLHVRSPEADARPLILTHGWPGAVLEFLDTVGPLTDPVAHGGDAGDAFHVVIPSLPGYGWSGKPAETGWGVQRVADAWAELMHRLGYEHFGAQGGDWGSAVTSQLAARHPDRVTGIHLNMISAQPPPDQTSFTPREQVALDAIALYRSADSGYARIQSTRPQTLGYALVDSPAGQCAWILDKFWAWSDTGGDPVGVLGADRILDIVSTYWFARAATSSARLYIESWGRNADGAEHIATPTGVSLFPKDIYCPPREWAQRRYTDIRTWHELDAGGHFAAFERPAVFVDEVRQFFRAL